jgi:hypothetical protein
LEIRGSFNCLRKESHLKKTKKLTLRKETLTDLQRVNGGVLYYNNTVYYPVETDFCTRGCPVWA